MQVRPVGHGQAGDQGLQQLALAGSGGAGDQAVGPVVGQVDDEGTGSASPMTARVERSWRPPPGRHGCRGRGARGRQVEQPHGGGDRGAARRPPIEAQGGQGPGRLARRSRPRPGRRGRGGLAAAPGSEAHPGGLVGDRSRATAWHSSGSSRSASSRQMQIDADRRAPAQDLGHRRDGPEPVGHRRGPAGGPAPVGLADCRRGRTPVAANRSSTRAASSTGQAGDGGVGAADPGDAAAVAVPGVRQPAGPCPGLDAGGVRSAP